MDKTSMIIGILIGAVCMFFLIHLLWRLGYYIFCGMIGVLHHSEQAAENLPKSLANLEAMVLPLAKRDFPDVDLSALKEQVRQALQIRYENENGFLAEKIVLNDYRKQDHQNILVFEASVQWQEKKPVHRKVSVYLKAVPGKHSDCCPSCGAPTKRGDIHCRECGNPLSAFSQTSWEVFKFREC